MKELTDDWQGVLALGFGMATEEDDRRRLFFSIRPLVVEVWFEGLRLRFRFRKVDMSKDE